MANPILTEVRTHPFTSVYGQQLRIVDRGEGHEPYLETSDALYIGPCRHTGPEILKLASEGAKLWNALNRLVAAEVRLARTREYGVLEKALDLRDAALVSCQELLESTAQTFDPNEPTSEGGA